MTQSTEQAHAPLAQGAGDAPPPERPPALSALEFGRWIWRQLTSMRVALILLFVLAVAAIPGSVIPQTEINPVNVADFRERNPELAQWYDRLGLFDVFSAPWFAAIYIALLVSLVGCILPRLWQHFKAIRAQPPRAPRRLTRLPSSQTLTMDAAPADVLEAARAELKSRRYRIAADRGDNAVAAEIGYLRETGNLLFHLAVVGVLLAVAYGTLFGYRATVIVPEGAGFSNTVVQFDTLEGGSRFDSSSLPPFTIDVESFEMDFIEAGSQIGSPDNFEATVTFVPEPGAEPETRTIRVNEPLAVDGSLVHILNPGYAPVVTVRSPDERILYEGPSPFLQIDGNYTSEGVFKVEVPPSVGEHDIGIDAVFVPTATSMDVTDMRSAFPEPRVPVLFFTAFYGDLGTDSGQSQSVYRLDVGNMTQFESDDGVPYTAALPVGETIELPNGYYVTFDGYVTWVQFQISRNAGKEAVLVAAILAVIGLLGSLYARRRRAWVRAQAGDDGSTVVEVGGLRRGEDATMDAEIEAIVQGLRGRLSPSSGKSNAET
jgi:cytochrome c biogenesis protein